MFLLQTRQNSLTQGQTLLIIGAAYDKEGNMRVTLLRRLALLLGLFAILGLLAVACGDEEEGVTTPTPAVTRTPAATGTPAAGTPTAAPGVGLGGGGAPRH